MKQKDLNELFKNKLNVKCEYSFSDKCHKNCSKYTVCLLSNLEKGELVILNKVKE